MIGIASKKYEPSDFDHLFGLAIEPRTTPKTMPSLRTYKPKNSTLPLLLALVLFSAQSVSSAKAPTVLCKTIGTSLQFEVINPLIKTPQQGRGHIKVQCRNHSDKSQRFAIAIYQKNKDELILKKDSNSQIRLELFADGNRKTPLSDRSGGTALKLEASVAEHTESLFEVPFFAQLTFPKIPEAGEHIQAAEFEVVYQPTTVDTPIHKISFQPGR